MVRLFFLGLLLCFSCCSLIDVENVGSASSDPGLVFWNRVDSLVALTNSVVGPGIVYGSADRFSTGKWGNGLYSPKSGLRINRSRLPGGFYKFDQFAVEFWLKADSKPDAEPRHVLGTIASGKSGIEFYFGNGYNSNYYTAFQILDLNYSSGITNRLEYRIDHVNQAGCSAYLPVGVWTHFAVSVDMSRTNGDRIHIYKNGVKQTTYVGIKIGALPRSLLCVEDVYLLHAYGWDNDGFVGTMDNLKFYNYAKNNFDATRE